MRRMLVTGGAGFIGSNFIRFWRGRYPEDRITNLDKLTYAGNLENLEEVQSHPSYEFVRGDICDTGLVENVFRTKAIDTVVHLAAESHVDRSILGPGEFIRTNVHGTFALLEAARKFWLSNTSPTTDTHLFLHVSTDEVYGSLGPEHPSFREITPYAPTSPYSASKAAADHLVRAYFHTYGLPAVITNGSNNYGPYQFPEKLIPLVIYRGVHGGSIPLYGDGGNVRDWLYVDDHCAALEAVLEKRPAAGGTYNIGGGEQWRNIDIVNLICDLLDDRLGSLSAPRRSLIEFVDDRPGHDRRYATDISKISRALDWRPKETLETGIAKTIDWYLSHQSWVQRVSTGEYQSYFAAQYGSRLSSK